MTPGNAPDGSVEVDVSFDTEESEIDILQHRKRKVNRKCSSELNIGAGKEIQKAFGLMQPG